MRIHTRLTAPQMATTLHDMPGVAFYRLSEHGSRTHTRAFEVILSGTSNHRGFHNDYTSATWDEWGIFLGRVFRADPHAKAGDVYANRRDFLRKTGKRYTNTFTSEQQHRRHRWEWNGGGVNERRCNCGARMSWV